MGDPDTIPLPADTGDQICLRSLCRARSAAMELHMEPFLREIAPVRRAYLQGKVDLASIYLGADPDLVMTVENEITFLLGRYLEPRP